MSLKPEVIALGARGRVLGTRTLGAELAEEIRERIAASERTILIDFNGVEVASSPVLDEIACALRAAIRDYEGRCVVLSNMNDDVRATMKLVVESRAMGLATLTERRLEILGGRAHLEETLAEAQELGTFTAADLAERLRIKLPNLHQRLAQLQEAGAVARVEPDSGDSRRAFKFVTPQPDDLVAA